MKVSEIVVLYNEPVEGSGADDWDVLSQVMAVEKALTESGISVTRLGIHIGFMQQVEELAAKGVKYVFNLVEAIHNISALNYFVPSLLNVHGIAYSGNPLEALFITTSKRLTCQILKQNGIVVPRSCLPSGISTLKKGRKYILKPVWEEGSAGITAGSVFTYDGKVPENVSLASDHSWYIEEFIDGREFNVSILSGDNGPEVLPLAEIVFHNFEADRPRIVDYHAKWTPGSFEYENTLRVFPDMSHQPTLDRQLRQTALDTWKCLGLNGYARVDMRVDDRENVIVLEANANPCISPDSGFVAAARQAGFSFTEVVLRIISHMNNLPHDAAE